MNTKYEPGQYALLKVMVHTSEHDSSIVSYLDVDNCVYFNDRVKHADLHPFPRKDEYRLTAAAFSAIALQFMEHFKDKPHASVPQYIEWMENRLENQNKENND